METPGHQESGHAHAYGLAFTRYCYYQYCIVHSIHTGGRKGSRILSNNLAIVLHQGGRCRWAGGKKGWLIRAHQPRSKGTSCKGQPTGRVSGGLGRRTPSSTSRSRRSVSRAMVQQPVAAAATAPPPTKSPIDAEPIITACWVLGRWVYGGAARALCSGGTTRPDFRRRPTRSPQKGTVYSLFMIGER